MRFDTRNNQEKHSLQEKHPLSTIVGKLNLILLCYRVYNVYKYNSHSKEFNDDDNEYK